MRTALYCSRCWRFLKYENAGRDVITWVTCDWCLGQLEGRVMLVGAQPAVCQECREPFEATRQAQKFCSASCRARHWREQRTGVAA